MDKVEEILTRGVEQVYPSKETVEKVLSSGKKLRIYHGIDPTGKLHLGHMVSLKKLRQFQDLGQEVIVLIGDFTAQIGDPADKSATRKKLTKEEVEGNAVNYKKLIGKILDLDKSNVRFLHNEEWTNKLKPTDLLDIASCFTVSQLLERDMFQKRIKESKEIYIHEFLYPIFQAYDSVTMDVDMEIGGSDQIFNMLAGRTLMKKLRDKEKFVLAMQLLAEPGKEKMGKTTGNLIALDEKPSEMFGKIMSWPDSMIIAGFTLLTDVPLDKVETSNLNPMDQKKWLASEIIKTLHSEKEAKEAKEEFEKVFQKGELPSETTVYQAKDGTSNLVDLLVDSSLILSKSEAKRIIEQGGVEIDGQTITDPQQNVELKNDMIVKVGKRRFLKVSINQ